MDLANKDLNGHDLRGSHLVGANLSQIQAENAQLNGAYLNESNLTDANLAGANLSDAQLLGANFTNTNFTSSNLTGANLTGADLHTATLNNANFTEAQLNGVNLAGVVFPALNLDQAQMRGANLQAANLTGQQLTGTDLRDADLRNANLSNMTLNQIKLAGAHLGGANFQSTQLAGVSFFQAILDGAIWVGGQICKTPSRTVCGYEWLVNTDTVGNQQYPSIAMAADGSSIIVWNNTASQPHIVGQRYDPYGQPIGGQIAISQTLSEPYSEADVSMASDGSFVVTWDHNNDGNNWGIIARQFNADASPKGNEFVVNTHTTGDQWYPTVAMSSDGRFIVAWYDNGLGATYYRRFEQDGSSNMAQDTVSPASFQVDVAANNDYFAFTWRAADANNYGVYARLQRHDASNAQFTHIPLNTTTSGNQQMPAIALSDSYLVTAWESQYQDGSGYGIYARYFNIDPQTMAGVSSASEFPVNTYTSFDQKSASVAVDPTGNFVIAWQSAGQDGSANSIYAQRFNARYRERVGSEFKLNTYSTDNQILPTIALAPNRHIRAAWVTQGQDGNGLGIAATQLGY